MADILRDDQFIDNVEVTFIPDLLVPANHVAFVLFRGHGSFLLPLTGVRVTPPPSPLGDPILLQSPARIVPCPHRQPTRRGRQQYWGWAARAHAARELSGPIAAAIHTAQ